MKPPRKIVHVEFSAKVHREIQRRARKADIPVSTWVRTLVVAWIDGQPKVQSK